MEKKLGANKEVSNVRTEIVTLGKVTKLTKGGGKVVLELFGKYGK